MKNKIKFIGTKSWLGKNHISQPIPTIKKIPDWYKNAERYYKFPNGEFAVDPYTGGKNLTWKSCPAIYDIMGTGYVYTTPCDIEFKVIDGKITAKVLDSGFSDFIHNRDLMPGFETPHGYHAVHFAWYADWACQTPKGYSVLYSHPFLRYDLPFITTSGIVDNDKVHLPGTMPFFVRDNWEGVLPAGTPFIQLVPFKREDWDSEFEVMNPLEVWKAKKENTTKYRVKDGGVYQKDVWERRKYQ